MKVTAPLIIVGTDAVERKVAAGATRRIFGGRVKLNAAAQQTVYIEEAGGNLNTGTAAGQSVFYIDPADFDKAESLRLRGTLIVNATNPGIDWTFSLLPVTAVGGAASAVNTTVGAAVTNSSFTILTATAIAAAMVTAVSGAIAVPASAGFYVIALAQSGNMAASSSVVARAALQAYIP